MGERVGGVFDPQGPGLAGGEDTHGARGLAQHVLEVIVGEVTAQQRVDLLHDQAQGAQLDGGFEALDDGRMRAVGVALGHQERVAVVPLVQQVDAPQRPGEREFGAARPHVGDGVDAASAHGFPQAGHVLVRECLVADPHECPRGGVRDGGERGGIFVADDCLGAGGVEHGRAARSVRLGHEDRFLLQCGVWAYSSMVEQRTFNP